jgi:hypothetical protein
MQLIIFIGFLNLEIERRFFLHVGNSSLFENKILICQNLKYVIFDKTKSIIKEPGIR